MFGDWGWDDSRTAAQQARLEAWLRGVGASRLVIVECGAGTAKIESVIVEVPESWTRTTRIGIREPKADAQTIRPDAQLLFVAGAGARQRGFGRVGLEVGREEGRQSFGCIGAIEVGPEERRQRF